MNHLELCANLLGKGSYERSDAPFATLEIVGPDAGGFLQGLCSQDVLGLAEGRVAPAAFLNAKGRVQFTCLVCRRGESVWLETPVAQVEALQELLERYHFSEKLTIHRRELGPCTERVEVAADELLTGECSWREDGQLGTVCVTRRGIRMWRTYGEVADGEAAAQSPMTTAQAETARMLAGFVLVGVETEASTLVIEAGLADHCSLRKGCYTGQEIVARIYSYGHVNRQLCVLRLEPGDAIKEPVALHELEDDIPIGRVMYAIELQEPKMRLGVGYLPSEFQELQTQAREDWQKLSLAGETEVRVLFVAPLADPEAK
jgi:tRNA-modifying protein YgfZ